MRVGFVSLWCNRGQGIVTRQLRSILDDAGHETFVLARPTAPDFAIPDFVDTTGPWAQPNVTVGSASKMAVEEYVAWAYRHRLEAVFFFTNRHFAATRALRERGIRTIGTFMWERFRSEHVAPTLAAYDAVYSLTDCGLRHFESLGVPAHRVRWGLHPELLHRPALPPDDHVRLVFHGGVHGDRKPTREVIEAFRAVDAPDARLVLKCQVADEDEYRTAAADPRIEVVVEDLPDQEYRRLVAGAHVLVAPSRFEGLGLHLYEALAWCMPVLANDMPPVNEVVEDGRNGRLCRSDARERGEGHFVVHEPDLGDLTRCLADLTEMRRVRELSEGARRRREDFPWSATVQDVLRLLAAGASPDPRPAGSQR